MPGNPHPFTEPYEDRDASALLGATKLHQRLVVADPDEVRNAVLSDQFGGIYIRSLDANFKIDTGDLQPDDGINVIHDDVGTHFVRLAVQASDVDKYVEAAGDVTLADDETADNVFIKNTSGAPINVFLPSAEVRTKKIWIGDDNNNAGTYVITVLPKSGSGQTILGGSSWVIDSNSSSYVFRPKADGTGYL